MAFDLMVAGTSPKEGPVSVMDLWVALTEAYRELEMAETHELPERFCISPGHTVRVALEGLNDVKVTLYRADGAIELDERAVWWLRYFCRRELQRYQGEVLRPVPREWPPLEEFR